MANPGIKYMLASPHNPIVASFALELYLRGLLKLPKSDADRGALCLWFDWLMEIAINGSWMKSFHQPTNVIVIVMHLKPTRATSCIPLF